MGQRLAATVLECSRAVGNSRLVLAAIGLRVDDESRQGQVSVSELCALTGLHDISVRRLLHRLQASGELCTTRGTGSCANSFRIDVTERAPRIQRKAGRPRKPKERTKQPDAAPVSKPERAAAAHAPAALPKPQPPPVEGLEVRGISKAESARKSKASNPGQATAATPPGPPNGTSANGAAPMPMPMPTGYKVRPDTIAWAEAKAAEYGVKMNAAAFAEKFEHHYTNGKGKGLQEIDWDAKFKTWVFEDIEKRSLEEKGKSNGRHSENGIGLATQPGPDTGRASGAPRGSTLPGFNVKRFVSRTKQV